MPSNVTHRGPVADEPSSISTSLLLRLKSQQPEAWQRLAELYGPVVMHWCLRARLQRVDSEDVVQEVFRTVAAKIESFHRENEGGTFRGWLWMVTRNKVGDHIRRSGRQPAATGGSDVQARLQQLEAASESSSFEVGTLYHSVLKSLRSEFREQTWEAFWQVVIDGLSPAVVADRLGTTPNAVYLAKSRVLRRIREELGDPLGES